MKKLIALLFALALVFTLAACGCEHEFAAADCVNPATCTLCGETEGEALGHVWMAATCETPKTCENCGVTDGEPKGHSMVEATCEEAKHCETCKMTEGEALGHAWLDATTETPKTCETCATTEGERIITDPRFTTAATQELQGKWRLPVPMTEEDIGIPGMQVDDCVYLVAEFANDGNFSITIEVTEKFGDLMKQILTESIYAEFELQGMDKEAADAAFAIAYGMSIQDYVDEELSYVDLNELFASAFGAIEIKGVYYVEDGLVYSADSWEDEMIGDSYTITGDTLTIEGMTEDLGLDSSFVRVKE